MATRIGSGVGITPSFKQTRKEVYIHAGLEVASREYVQRVRDWMEQADGDAEKLADLIVQNR